MTGVPALPISVSPRDGESIESWLEHLADANGLTTAQLLIHLRSRGASTRYLTLAPEPATIRTLAALARVPEKAVTAATLGTFDGTALDLTGLDPHNQHSYRQVAARGWTPAHGTQICPTCLAEDGAWRTAWRLLIVTACTRHRTLLATQCPACRRPFRDQRHSHLRRVGATAVCGNPLGAGPATQCQHDLATIPTTIADDPVLVTQARIDAALADRPVTVLGERACGTAYLTDVRHLTTLLIHLAMQPGAHRLASWTIAITAEVEQRTGHRGPRWGLRPPEPPALRAAALATADRILGAPDLEAAAKRLTPWTELTPITNDGPLGWLADRTVMTPTLTRLVMSARAAHRRLSHHLDAQDHDMDIDTRGIPQVIPARLYQEHLGGTSASAEATVRQFASLSLARLTRDVTSWGQAAEVLGMPTRMGVNCARACSATMLVDNEHWSTRLEQVWEGLADHYAISGRWNYRLIETKLHRRWQSHRWFEEWVRAVRPNTRRESRGYALTWQWIHRAHGHIDTSPAWNGQRPNAAQRARYRQFAASLDDEQQRELSYAFTKRA
ncbi:TniQ family protein [Calidifontibacter indicus]|uniref:TniQ family protein n=1 Tax=Calidifontibacter indicus TaxID=419650 RepID=UPI003D71CF9D